MIDFEHIQKYRENNRIEAKKAVGGLPQSIWETYSAFANTLGGIILLGMEEHSDHSLHPVKLPDPEQLVEDFWELVKNKKKASVNILSENDVTIEDADGKKIVAICVPRAPRALRPVYVEGNPMTGTYRRNGEGDYRCTPDEVRLMIRESSQKPTPIPEQKKTIITHITEKITATSAEIADLLDIELHEAEQLLFELMEKDVLILEYGIYKLKA